MYIILSFFLYHCFTFFFHYFVKAKKNKQLIFLYNSLLLLFITTILAISLVKQFSFFLSILFLLVFIYYKNRLKLRLNKYLFLSPDFFYAKHIKNSFAYEKKRKNQYLRNKFKVISWWNISNLFISFVFFIITLFVYYFDITNKKLICIFLGFMLSRAFSRSIEIIIAFFFDIIDSKKKNKYLKSNRRIILSTRSYFEVILNFATLNFLGFWINKINNFSTSFLRYVITIFPLSKDKTPEDITPFFTLIKSFGTSTATSATVDSIFSVLQVITSLTIVLFALAGYLNNKGDNKKN